MSSVIDLSTLKSKSEETDFDSLSEEDQEALAKLAEENEPEGEQVRTAFLVVVTHDGTTIAVPDINMPLVLDHPASVDEIFGAAQVVIKDIQVQETAQHTAAFMQQMAMAQIQARQNAALAQRLDLKK